MSCLSVFSLHTCSTRDIANNRLSGNSPYSLLGKFMSHTRRTSSWVRQHSLHPPRIKMMCKINIHLTPRTHLRICIQQRKISLAINRRSTKCAFKSWHKSGFSSSCLCHCCSAGSLPFCCVPDAACFLQLPPGSHGTKLIFPSDQYMAKEPAQSSLFQGTEPFSKGLLCGAVIALLLSLPHLSPPPC